MGRRSLRFILLAGLTLPLFGSLAACSKNRAEALSAVEFQREAKAAYEKALESFHDRDWVGVPLLMAQVKKEYAGSRYARLAQLRIADAQFHQGSFAEAITAYREFLREFPNDDEVPYARYRVALCQFESRGESSLSPPLEERDLVNIRDADRTIFLFLKDYPNYKEREHLLYMQSWVRGMLARHELYVARYYLKRGKYAAAISRAEYAILNFQATGLEPEALVLLGETHMKRHEPEKAAEAFYIVIERYPDSPFVIASTNFLKKLEKDGTLKGKSSVDGPAVLHERAQKQTSHTSAPTAPRSPPPTKQDHADGHEH